MQDRTFNTSRRADPNLSTEQDFEHAQHKAHSNVVETLHRNYLRNNQLRIKSHHLSSDIVEGTAELKRQSETLQFSHLQRAMALSMVYQMLIIISTFIFGMPIVRCMTVR
jgi:hypothetical protein